MNSQEANACIRPAPAAPGSPGHHSPPGDHRLTRIALSDLHGPPLILTTMLPHCPHSAVQMRTYSRGEGGVNRHRASPGRKWPRGGSTRGIRALHLADRGSAAGLAEAGLTVESPAGGGGRPGRGPLICRLEVRDPRPRLRRRRCPQCLQPAKVLPQSLIVENWSPATARR